MKMHNKQKKWNWQAFLHPEALAVKKCKIQSKRDG